MRYFIILSLLICAGCTSTSEPSTKFAALDLAKEHRESLKKWENHLANQEENHTADEQEQKVFKVMYRQYR